MEGSIGKKSMAPIQNHMSIKLEKVETRRYHCKARSWKTKSMCIAKCLLNINKTKIMDVRYKVWANYINSDDRITWILQKMHTFMEIIIATRWIEFKFCMAGTLVCSVCYAYALGYSRR
jgi:hypothetical protein